jgi:3-dehydroquinate synthase
VREITLKAGGAECRILVGAGFLEKLPDLLPRGLAPKGAVVVDGHVKKLAPPLIKVLAEAGIAAIPFVIPPGERSKSLANLEKLLRGFAREGLERKSPVIALGGGMVGDLAGFAAATFLRGVPLIQVPTTLLAQVDAAIGGKNAVNLPEGKNLVGTFYQPARVLIDTALLATLPERDFVGGLAEVVKYGMILDEGLFTFVEKNIAAIRRLDAAALKEVVARCVALKASVVERDEREGGVRAVLNYGHTVGHALEAVGEYSRVHHGEAVSIGMEAAAFMSMRLGMASLETLEAQNRLLRACGLPTRMPGLARREVLKAMQRDKKVRDGRPAFVLPEKIGKVRFGVDVPDDVVEAALKTVGGK